MSENTLNKISPFPCFPKKDLRPSEVPFLKRRSARYDRTGKALT